MVREMCNIAVKWSFYAGAIYYDIRVFKVHQLFDGFMMDKFMVILFLIK